MGGGRLVDTPTTQVPDTIEGQIGLGKSLGTYLTKYPNRERPDDDITAAKATELTVAATTTQRAVATAEEAFKAANDARKPAKADLLKLIGEVIGNLDMKLSPSDPRWLAFGLQLPSTPTTPAAPTGLRATIMDTKVLLECDAMELATRYRFRGKIIGVDPEVQAPGQCAGANGSAGRSRAGSHDRDHRAGGQWTVTKRAERCDPRDNSGDGVGRG